PETERRHMEEFINFVSNFSGPEAYALIFAVLLACGLGVPIPEDITLFAAGYLAYEGAGNLWGMILVSFAGVMVGDSLIFFLGARYGQRLTRYWMFSRLLPPDRLEAVREKFRQKGLKLLFAARFMPGLRA